MTTIGVVGLGAMGGRIAGRLLSQGNDVFGTNRTKARANSLIEQGMQWCDSPRQTAEAADVIISMVTDNDALEAVNSGSDGILAGLAPGQVYIEMSTVSPQASRTVAEQVASRGASMLAAPVSGSVRAVEEGSLAIMVGGDVVAFERVEAILRQLGSRVTFVGEGGHALLLKMAINISLAVQMLAFSEGVLLAERGGIERGLALDVLTGSAVGSPMLKARAPLVRELPDEAWFDVRLMQKDVRLALDSARSLGVPLPSTVVADELLTVATALGYEHRDIAVLFQVLSELDGDRARSERGLATA
ncbi:MAG TPA: NAD(P)-dependent oxidoreductase [Jatrophihabitans sp.]|jgi:3-hydroxyisobutyrate dehydrogenase-like beta-hydroxyacid dehydrogenase|nr:NAD(P)-dependent oxidoreductase [Jatrophihabitans sp.]